MRVWVEVGMPYPLNLADFSQSSSDLILAPSDKLHFAVKVCKFLLAKRGGNIFIAAIILIGAACRDAPTTMLAGQKIDQAVRATEILRAVLICGNQVDFDNTGVESRHHAACNA